MRNLLSLLTLSSLLLVIGCDGKYPSMEQAMDECVNWSVKEKRNIKYNVGTTRTMFARICEAERETNQILGKENKSVIDGTAEPTNRDKRGIYKVVKNFRY